MLYVISNHACDLLEVHFITAAFDILNLVKEAFDVVSLEIADEFTEEDAQLLIGHVVLTFVEKLQEVEDQLVGVCFHIIGDLLHSQSELSVFDLVALGSGLLK